jgi:hypothetical protein
MKTSVAICLKRKKKLLDSALNPPLLTETSKHKFVLELKLILEMKKAIFQEHSNTDNGHYLFYKHFYLKYYYFN